MTAQSEDITINIGGTDYSVYIDDINESGGEKEIVHVRTFGNNYESIETGRTNYELEFNFRIESSTLNTLYENTTAITITITIGSEMTVTYYNMLPKNLTIISEVENIAQAKLSYSAPAYDTSSSRYNRVVS